MKSLVYLPLAAIVWVAFPFILFKQYNNKRFIAEPMSIVTQDSEGHKTSGNLKAFSSLSTANEGGSASSWSAFTYFTCQQYVDGLPVEICANQPTPRGYVVTAYGNNMSCPDWTPGGMNTKIVSRPHTNISVCATSRIPNGYVVTRYGNSLNCLNWSPGGQTTIKIRRL